MGFPALAPAREAVADLFQSLIGFYGFSGLSIVGRKQ